MSSIYSRGPVPDPSDQAEARIIIVPMAATDWG
jgi:hypothetical protein